MFCALSLLTAPAVSADDTEWVLSLGGVGATVTDPSDTTFGVDLALGITGNLILPNEIGVRQSFAYANDDVTLNTRLYYDTTLLTIEKVNLDLFIGGAVGLEYGNQKPSWEIAPEAGLRWWLKEDVAVLGRAELPWDMDGWEFKDVVRYFIGFQVKL